MGRYSLMFLILLNVVYVDCLPKPERASYELHSSFELAAVAPAGDFMRSPCGEFRPVEHIFGTLEKVEAFWVWVCWAAYAALAAPLLVLYALQFVRGEALQRNRYAS